MTVPALLPALTAAAAVFLLIWGLSSFTATNRSLARLGPRQSQGEGLPGGVQLPPGLKRLLPGAGSGAGADGSHMELALMAVSVAFQSGKTLPQALEHASECVEEPLASEIAGVALRARSGDWEEALAAWAAIRPEAGVAALRRAVHIHRAAGGSLVPLLRRLTSSIREERLTKARARAQQAEARLSATVLSLIPVAMGAFMMFLRPDLMAETWADPLGRAAFFYALLSWIAGVIVIRRLVDIDGVSTGGGDVT